MFSFARSRGRRVIPARGLTVGQRAPERAAEADEAGAAEAGGTQGGDAPATDPARPRGRARPRCYPLRRPSQGRRHAAPRLPGSRPERYAGRCTDCPFRAAADAGRGSGRYAKRVSPARVVWCKC